MKPNILFVMVDCLRYDRIVSQYMPWLSQLAEAQAFFRNYWSVSHCTDPSVTAMITGKHPDALRLYSMMFERREYSIPKSTKTILQKARAEGYRTVSITGQWRWYFWGADISMDSRNWPRRDDFDAAIQVMEEVEQPWFVFMHNVDMHREYANGSYDAAAAFVDEHLKRTVAAARRKGAITIVVSDHGEGLGQSGPDGHEIEQHGWGLWDFITHVPLIVDLCTLSWEVSSIDDLVCNLDLYKFLQDLVSGNVSLDAFAGREYVFQAGGTPKMFQRGIVYPNQRQYILAREDNRNDHQYWIGDFSPEDKLIACSLLSSHCTKHGITVRDDEIVLDRLRGIGYFE